MIDENTLVVVRRQWNDWRTGRVLLRHLHDFQWRDRSGGVMAASPRPFVHARMWCNALIDGEVAHSCSHGPGPHEIFVCIVKKDNTKDVIAEIVARADAKRNKGAL